MLKYMEEIKLVYYILGLLAIIFPLIGQFFWVKFKLTQLEKDSISKNNLFKEECDTKIKTIEEKRLLNVAALREIYNAKIEDSKKYSKGLFEQRSDSINSLEKKVDKIEIKLELMATQKSVDDVNGTLTKIVGLIIDKKNSENVVY